MTSSANQRKGRPRRTALAWVRANHPATCALCGYPIDMSLDYQTHPMASTVDERIPVHYGGSTTDRSNLQHVHRTCNATRGKRPITPEVTAECRRNAAQHLGITPDTTATTTRTW